MAEYAELISSTHKSFSIEDDIGAISRISESLLSARLVRQRRRNESKAILHDLSRTLDHQQTKVRSIRESNASADHDLLMNALDREKFALAKGINELEVTTQTLESTLLRVQQDVESTAEDIERDVSAYGNGESTVLKLAVFRDLGITLRDQDGIYTQAVVRSAGNKDVHMVALDRSGQGLYANQLWELCSQ